MYLNIAIDSNCGFNHSNKVYLKKMLVLMCLAQSHQKKGNEFQKRFLLSVVIQPTAKKEVSHISGTWKVMMRPTAGHSAYG